MRTEAAQRPARPAEVSEWLHLFERYWKPRLEALAWRGETWRICPHRRRSTTAP